MAVSQKYQMRSLQGLRCYAILLIFVTHYPFIKSASGGNALTWAGGLGVELFILLSGYLAAMQYDAGVSLGGLAVFKKKIGKFYPMHILTLLVAIPFSVDYLFQQWHLNTWIKLVLNFFSVQAWIPNSSIYFSFNGVAWYLSLTVFFVLVAPFVMKYISRLSASVCILGTGVIFVFQTLWCLLMQRYSFGHWAIYICPVIRLLDYVVGAFVYSTVKKYRDIADKKVYLVFFASILSMVALLLVSVSVDTKLFAVSVWTLPSALLLFALTVSEQKSLPIVNAVFANPAVVMVGNLSFEFFLLHQLVIRYGQSFADQIKTKQDTLYGVLLGVVALSLSWLANWIFRNVGQLRKLKSPKNTKEVS